MARRGGESKSGMAWIWLGGLCAFVTVLVVLSCPGTAGAQVPGIMGYQGRVTINGTNVTGTVAFKFALITSNDTGEVTLWSHNGTGTNGAAPEDPGVELSVTRGLYACNLGDTNLVNMTRPVTPDVFSVPEVFLRVWVDDGESGFLRMTPDIRIAAVGYALVAQTALSAPAAAPASGAMLVSMQAQDTNLTANGYRLMMTVPAPSWVGGTLTNVPSARSGHSAVWDGSRMLVWGGRIAAGTYVASGGAYSPDGDAWTTLSTVGAPEARAAHAAVWSGSEMLVWGGVNLAGYVTAGGRFTPGTQAWSAMTTNDAPAGRQGHVAVWTGSRLLVWGGVNASGLLDDGALYDPVSNRWSALAVAAPPAARSGAAAAWCGDRLVVWGGEGESGPLDTGAQLIFSNGVPSAWVAMTSSSAPSARSGVPAVWTGDRLLVWGGRSGDTPLADGAAYDPVADAWTALAASNAPAARYDHIALWNDSELLILTGANASGTLSSGSAYDPATALWRSLGTSGSPVARSQATAVWSGTEILVFGGLSGAQPVAALQRLTPQPAWYFYRKL